MFLKNYDPEQLQRFKYLTSFKLNISIFSQKMVEISWMFYDVQTSFIQKMSENFHKFEKFLEK